MIVRQSEELENDKVNVALDEAVYAAIEEYKEFLAKENTK